MKEKDPPKSMWLKGIYKKLPWGLCNKSCGGSSVGWPGLCLCSS